MKRVLSIVLIIIMLLCVCPWSTLPAKATMLSLSELQAKFPHGKYWNGGNANSYTSSPCNHHGSCSYSGSCGCNSFLGLSIQCMGYAEKLGYDATGYNPRNNANGWYTYTDSSALDALKPGDIVRYKNDGHSIYVIGVNGNTVTYTDCNNDGHCIIRWDATISKATLRASFTHVRSAPSTVSQGAASCTCSSEYEGTYICTTNSANLMIRSGHGTAYGTIGSIPSGATVYITKASGVGAGHWAHVEYSGISGYASMEYLEKQGPELDVRFSHWLSYDKMGDKITSARQGEWVYLCYRLYDKTSGKNLNEVKSYNYTVKETIYKPNGAVAYSYAYTNSDHNWIGTSCDVAGQYTYVVELTGDWNGTYTKTFTVSEIKPMISAWVSDTGLGDQASEYIQGNRYYFCYKIFDQISGELLDDVQQKSYSVKMTVIYPDGTEAEPITYTNDDNWVSLVLKEPGQYSCRIEVTGDFSYTGTLRITAEENPKKIYVSTDTVNLMLGGTEETTIYVWTTGYHETETVLTKSASNSVISTTWGDWNDDGLMPITIFANGSGSTQITLQVQEKASGLVLDTVVVNVSVITNAYTITYDGVLISEVPSAQVKKHGEPLTLSTMVPGCFAYTFQGWATSASAVEAEYLPGDQYTVNEDVTLYAVWAPAEQIENERDLIIQPHSNLTRAKVYFKLVPDATSSYRLELIDADGEADVNMVVYDAWGRFVSDVDGTVDPENMWSTCETESYLAAGETYYIKLEYTDADREGIYFLVTRGCQIAYHGNGGSNIPATEYHYSGPYYISSDIPVREGYEFVAWSTGAEGTGNRYAPGTYCEEGWVDVNLYAVWRRTDRLVYGDVDRDGTVVFTDCAIINKVRLGNYTPEYDYNEFLLRSDLDRDGTITLTDVEITNQIRNNKITDDELHSAYVRSTVKGIPRTLYQYGETLDTAGIMLEIMFDTGMTYVISEELKVDGFDPYRYGQHIITVSFYQFTATYVVEVETPTYTVTYNANGGYGIPEEQTKVYGRDLILSDAVPARLGYTFVGWATGETAASAEYPAGGVFSDNADTVLYAVWERGCAADHQYSVEELKYPTVEMQGVMVLICDYCGDTQWIAMPCLNTTDYTYSVNIPATCTSDGLGFYTWENPLIGFISFSDRILQTGHTYISHVTTNATCTQKGIKTYTCADCGDSYTEDIPATGHNYSSDIVDPGCAFQGYTEHCCEKCGDTYQSNYIPALGHEYSSQVINPATCTDSGDRKDTCDRCGDVYIHEIPALGHQYSDGVCIVCGVNTKSSVFTGTVTSFGDASEPVNMCTYREGEDRAEDILTIRGNTFTVNGLTPGVYTVTFSKRNHVTREYTVNVTADETVLAAKIHLIGDVTGDGRVNVGDVSRIYAHAKKNGTLDDYEFLCADVTGDGRVNVGDASRVYGHSKKTASLW